jgi:hypothetical protein
MRIQASFGPALTPEERKLSPERQMEIRRSKTARFERKWGVYYMTVSLVAVLWLVLMAMWDRL